MSTRSLIIRVVGSQVYFSITKPLPLVLVSLPNVPVLFLLRDEKYSLMKQCKLVGQAEEGWPENDT